MSLYERKHYTGKGYGKGKSNSYNNWSEPFKISYYEGQIMDFRDLHQRETDDGSMLKISDDDNNEVLCYAVSRPRSHGSIKNALKDKRGIPLFASMSQNWIRCSINAQRWEHLIQLDLDDDQMKKVAQTLSKLYQEFNKPVISLRSLIDHEEDLKKAERLKKLGPKAKTAFYAMNPDDDKDEEVDEVMAVIRGVNPAVPPNGTPNPRDRKRHCRAPDSWRTAVRGVDLSVPPPDTVTEAAGSGASGSGLRSSDADGHGSHNGTPDVINAGSEQVKAAADVAMSG